jgi:hypothetical protein
LEILDRQAATIGGLYEHAGGGALAAGVSAVEVSNQVNEILTWYSNHHWHSWAIPF